MARHTCMFTGRYVCRYQGPILRETIKGATTTCDRTGPPIYFSRRVRHRKRSSPPHAVSFCRGVLFLPTVPLSSYPKDLKAHLLGKLLRPFWLARRIIKASAHHCSSLSPLSDVNICRKTYFHPLTMKHSSSRGNMKIFVIKACHTFENTQFFLMKF